MSFYYSEGGSEKGRQHFACFMCVLKIEYACQGTHPKSSQTAERERELVREKREGQKESEREKWKDKTRLQMCKQQFPKVSFLLLLLFESESASVSV